MAKTIEQEWSTRLSAADLAGWFKATAHERYDEMGHTAKASRKFLEHFTSMLVARDPQAQMSDASSTTRR